MSTDLHIADPPDYTEEDSREEVMNDLKEAIDEAFYKFAGQGRIRDGDNEKIRIRYLKAFTQAVGEYRRLVESLEESEQEARIERLEALVDELE